MEPRTHVQVIRGRDHETEDQKPLCTKSDLVKILSAKGIGVYGALCKRIVGEKTYKCEYYSDSDGGCAYYKQFKIDENIALNIRIYQQQALGTIRNQFEEQKLNLMVVDESYYDSLLGELKIGAAKLNKLGELGEIILKALENDKPLLAAVKKHGPTGKQIKQARKGIPSKASKINPTMDEVIIRNHAHSHNKINLSLHTLLDVLETEIKTGRDKI